jgi:hypothetical protein
MADIFTGGGKVKDRVTWVATALPLRDEEICVKPTRFRALVNRSDNVSQMIGFRLRPEKLLADDIRAAHDFIKGYLDQIQPEDIR